MTTQHSLAASAQVRIEIPAEVSASSPSCTAVSHAASCSFSTPTLTMTLSAPTPASQQLKFKLSGFTNPTLIGTSSFTYKTLLSNGGTVDTCSASQAYSPGALSVAVAYSTVTSAVNDYSFTITNSHALPVGGYVEVGLPAEVVIPDCSTVVCSYGAINPPCSCDSATNTVKV
jgi:hypothetical protein